MRVAVIGQNLHRRFSAWQVEGISTAEYGAAAPRPAYSILENYMLKLTGGYQFADWHDAIEEYIKTL